MNLKISFAIIGSIPLLFVTIPIVLTLVRQIFEFQTFFDVINDPTVLESVKKTLY